MAKRKNTAAKVFAFIALFGIVLGIIWTWALFIFGNSQAPEQKVQTINPEQLQKMIENMQVEVNTWVTK